MKSILKSELFIQGLIFIGALSIVFSLSANAIGIGGFSTNIGPRQWIDASIGIIITLPGIILSQKKNRETIRELISNHKSLLILVFAFSLGLFWLNFIYFAGLRFSPDSVFYMTFAVNMHYAADYYVSPAWAPLYPFLINLGMYVQKFPAESAALISGISMIGILLTYGSLLNKFSEDFILKLLFLLLLFFFTKFLSIYDLAWSETPFSFLILLSFYFIINHYKKHRLYDYVFASLSISLATLTRYAGIPLLVLFIVYTFYFLFRESDFRQNAAKYLLINSLSYIPIVLYMRNNYITTGTFFGERVQPELTIFDNLYRTIGVFRSDFTPYLLLLLLLTTVFYLVSLKNSINARLERIVLFSLSTIALALFTYISFIIYTTSQASVDPISTRYYAPTYPLIFVLIFIGVNKAIHQKQEIKWFKNLLPIQIVIYSLILLSLIVQLISFNIFVDTILEKRSAISDHISSGFNLSSSARDLSEFFRNELKQKQKLHVTVIPDPNLPAQLNSFLGNSFFFRESMLQFSDNRVEFRKVWNSGYRFSIQAANDNYNLWVHNVQLFEDDQQLTNDLKKIFNDFDIASLVLIVYKGYLYKIGTDEQHYEDSISPTITDNFKVTRVVKIDPYYLYELSIK